MAVESLVGKLEVGTVDGFAKSGGEKRFGIAEGGAAAE